MKQLTSIDLLAGITTKLKSKGIDVIVTSGTTTTLEIDDIMTSRTIAVVKGVTLEDAYVNLFAALASSVRRSKNGIPDAVDYTRLTRL